MKRDRAVLFFALLPTLAAVTAGFGHDEFAVALPDGVKAVWDITNAYREGTATRERICINGLWRWQPARISDDHAPTMNWGYFKVPGCWPGITDYMQKDSQTVHIHPSWKSERFGDLAAAWYERTITVPEEWAARRVALSVEYLNSYATVYVDGMKRGELRFPGGELDLTGPFRPGSTHVLSLLVVAMPLKGVLLSYTDSNSAREVKGKVERRGLCGDVFLVSAPAGPGIGDVKVETSVRKSEITWGAELENLAVDARYILRARVVAGGRTIKEFNRRTVQAGGLKERRIEFTEKWMPDKLWDIHTPQNTFGMELSLLDAAGKLLDVRGTVRFGFREFWIEGRDFFLNGKRIHLSAVPLDNAQVGAAISTYHAARESLDRLKSIGINFVYTHNYGCEPGSHLSFTEILRAADDLGMLVALSQPHFSHYDWKSPDADEINGYARHAVFYTRVAQGHPSVVMYSMSHNATGYEEDMNPDMIDGIHDPRDAWSARNAKLAVRAEAIVKRLDPGRIVYHHASGNLGSMHVMNFYPNFVPIQELSDWFGHWATRGVKPAFLCEYGAPFTWDWTMYRGWYKSQREFGSAKVPWEFCLAEWNAQFFGDRAYAISEAEKANLRWEAKQFRAGNLWYRWDYPNEVGSPHFDERYPVFARYLTDAWRAFRTWGVSAISPWEYGHFWKLRDGADKRREEFKVDWDNLQRPGFSPDYSEQRYERMDIAFGRSDWVATPAAEALLRNNQPLLAYISGKPDHFTGKDHNFLPGDIVEKQIIVINDSRESVRCDGRWSLELPKPVGGGRRITVAPGRQQRVPLRFELPRALAPGRYELNADFKFGTGATQSDRFAIDVLERSPSPLKGERAGVRGDEMSSLSQSPLKDQSTSPLPTLSPPSGSGEGPSSTGRGPSNRPLNKIETKVALFDPKGETRAWLDQCGVKSQPVDAITDLSPYDMLIIGKAALTVGGPAPDITRVREGLRVILFEQTSEVLEKRFGFRVEEYGLRQVFPRVPDHPVLAGVAPENLRDWHGEATILPPRLDYTLRPRYGPTVNWCDIPVPRLWRCGNRGTVASVLIEKPARGDFLPILDGGYSLQYSPLLEFREGRGMILFCQMDVTGRTESDPAADTLARNILQYVSNWKSAPIRTAVYAGDSGGKRHLETAGFVVASFAGEKLSRDQVLVVGPGGGRELGDNKAMIAEWLKAGGNLLAFGLDQQNADALLPLQVTFRKAEHISAWFDPAGVNSLLRGVAPADVHNRDPRELPLIVSGATPIGDGVLAAATDPNIVFCQLVPWQFDPAKQSNLKRTYRRASFLVTRLLANLGVASASPILSRFNTAVDTAKPEKRWLDGLYLDQPEEWDDPYRFFRW